MQAAVREFMLKTPGQDVPDKPIVPDEKIRLLRVKLIAEELEEFLEASGVFHDQEENVYYSSNFKKHDSVEVADAIGDLLYVVFGAAIAWGIDIHPVFEEIHRSNMTKFIDGYMRDDGKWQKGPGYSPADLYSILQSQMD